MACTTVVAEMYGAPMDVVAQMLDVSLNRAYRVAQKWQKAGLISDKRLRPVPGPAWIFPTKSAAESLLGRPVRYWMPTPKMAAHTRAVLELRLALVGLDLDRWISERELRSDIPWEKGQTRPHIHDGRFYTQAGDLWAVEVELTRKDTPVARRTVLEAWKVAQSAGCAGVGYYCRKDDVKKAIRDAAASLNLPATAPKLRLFDLDEILAAGAPVQTTEPGLRLITGGFAAAHRDLVADPKSNHETGKAVSS